MLYEQLELFYEQLELFYEQLELFYEQLELFYRIKGNTNGGQESVKELDYGPYQGPSG